MRVHQKEIYASIEFVEQEIRFVLGEFHNSRLNILNVEILPTSAISNDKIINENQLISDIKTLIENVNRKMKVNVERVIVVVPSRNLQRYSKRLTIGLHEKTLDQDLITYSINNVANRELASDELLVNSIVTKYFIDGISKNKIDFSQSINTLALDVDLYSGKKREIFELLNVVEKSGLEIIDICFDSIASASEMASYQASYVKNVINITYELNKTVLSLVSEGRILSNMTLNSGYGALIERVFQDHNLSFKSAEKLILSNDYLTLVTKEPNPIFIYSQNDHTVAIDDEYVRELAIPIFFEQFEQIYQVIDPIMMARETDIYLTGKGASIVGLSDVLSNILKSKVKVYVPEIIGARKCSLISNLGALYLYRDETLLSGHIVPSISEDFQHLLDVPYRHNESEDSMTNRFKELFKIN